MDNPIRRSAAPLSEVDLVLAEERLGLTLPAEYRAFLLRHNGGCPRRNSFFHVNKKGQKRESWVRYFYPLGRDGLLDPDTNDIENAYKDRPRGLPAGMFPIADAYFMGNDGFVCIGCTGEDAGKVFFRPEVDADKDTLYAVSDSFDAFLSGMTYEDGKVLPWKEAIQDGDIPKLREWLEKHKKKWSGDRSYSIDMERCAVEENCWPAVVLLMEFGFEPSSLFEEALSYNRFDMALELLKGGGVDESAVRECLCGATPYLWHLPPLLEELVKAGADVNHQDGGGDTPLHGAVDARSEEGVRFLLARGADPTVKNDDGRTPRKLANRLEEPRLAEVLKAGEEKWKQRPVEAGPAVVEFDFRGVEITDAGPPLTLADIQAFEQEIGLEFPPDYRGFLLKTNGGVPRPNLLPLPQPQYDEDEEEEDEEDGGEDTETKIEFLPLRKGHTRTRVNEEGDEWEGNSVESAREWYHDGTEIPRGKVPIGWLDDYAHEGAWLLLGCKGKDRGKLFTCHYGTAALDMTLAGLFEMLTQAKARPSSPGQRLAEAVAANDLPGVKAALADGARPTAGTRDGRYPLRMACEAGFDDAVMAMAEAGAKVDELVGDVLSAERIALFRRLLADGKGPSKKVLAEVLRYTSALYADVGLVRELMARGVDLKKRVTGKDAYDYLSTIAASGSVEAVKLAVELGGDLGVRNEEGETLLHKAAGARRGDPAAVVRHLLSLGLKPNQHTSEGHTALHAAVIAGNLEAARVLIDAGEDLHARHEKYIAGMTPEESAKHAQKVAKMAGKGFQGLMSEIGFGSEDAPPAPDTSHPMGEKMAELLEGFGKYVERVSGALDKQVAERAAGSWGKGRSAAEVAGISPQGQPILAELEAYAATKKSGQGT